MNTKIICSLAFSIIAATAQAEGIKQFEIPFGNQLPSSGVDGSVTVDIDSTKITKTIVEKKFYGVDTNGFSKLPQTSSVMPLQLGFVRLGGNLYSTYNWETNSYYDGNDGGIQYVYAPLETRIRQVQQAYKAIPMFQINMMGWMPDLNEVHGMSYMNTATAQHAANAITYLNGVEKLGVKNIIIDNEPFDWKDTHGKELPSADEYIAKYIEYVVALRSAQENLTQDANDIKIWGPEIASGWNGWQTTHPKDCVIDYTLPEKMKCSYGNGKFREFISYFLSKLAAFENDSVRNPKHYKMLDYLTFHYYPLFRSSFEDTTSVITNAEGKQDIKAMLESVNIWNMANYINSVDAASPKGIAPALINKFTAWRDSFYPTAKIAVTEYGIDSVDKVVYHPIIEPMYLADLMARVASSGVETFVNSFLEGGRWGMLEKEYKTRQYYVYSLYSNFFLGKIAKSSDTFGDSVNTYSTKTETSTNVFLVNKSAKETTTKVNFKINQSSSEVTELALPAWSVTVLSVPNDKSAPIKVYQYGALEMGINVTE
ncbi:MAG: glycoside hydrolase family 44 protein [Bacteriovoracaceae bacterium]